MLSLSIDAFVKRIHCEVPLTKQMQWQVKSITKQKLIANAPLQPNINDKGTFFGGSSAALMTISGWAWVKFQLESLEINHDVVIHHSHMRWKKPQTKTMSIQVLPEKQVHWPSIVKQLQQGNKAPIKVVCQGFQENTITTEMKATYAILT